MENFREIWVIASLAPIYIVAILTELVLSNARKLNVYSVRGFLENVYLSFLNIAFDVALRGVALAVLVWGYDHRFLDWETGLLYWVLLLLGEDLLYYCLHWIDHHSRLFWAIHVTHHSSEEFNLTVGFRSSVFQPFYRFVFFLPLGFAGFKPEDIFLMYSATQIYGILVHTQLVHKLGWLEHILVTPSHHRVHHACNACYLDKNLGMVFIIWDKLFGTFAKEAEPVQYGITKPIEKRDAVSLVFHEWRAMCKDLRTESKIIEKIKCMLLPPGWSEKKKAPFNDAH